MKYTAEEARKKPIFKLLWAQTMTGLTPTPEVYSRFLKAVSSDTETDDFHVPDDWV